MSIPILSSTIALRPRFLPTGAQSASLREEKSIISIAHDGKWLGFAEYSAGKREVYITPFPGRTGKWQVSTGGGHYPRWRGDGKELFFRFCSRICKRPRF
jgi:hypothetical protein